MKRIHANLLIWIVAIAAFTAGHWIGAGAVHPAPTMSGPASRAPSTEPSRLNLRLAKLDLDHVPLGEAIDAIAAKSQLNIAVHWAALEHDNIHRSDPVTIHLTDSSVADALEAIIPTSDPPDPKYETYQGIVVIPGTALRPGEELRIFDIRDLILDYAKFYQTHNGLGPAQPIDAANYQSAVSTYARMIATQANWNLEAINEIAGRLIVHGSKDRLAEIETTLAALRQEMREKLKRAP